VADLRHDVAELGGVAGAGGGQVDHGAGPVLAEDAQVDVSDQGLLGAAGAAAGALDGGDPADQRADLGIPQLLITKPGIQQPVLGVADQRLVDRAAAPQVAVGEQPWWLPGREDVELRVAVQVQQAGQDHPVSRMNSHALGLLGLDGLDLVAGADHYKAVLHRAGGGEHAALQRDRLHRRRPHRQLPRCRGRDGCQLGWRELGHDPGAVGPLKSARPAP
jgi:hypothetical protein